MPVFVRKKGPRKRRKVDEKKKKSKKAQYSIEGEWDDAWKIGHEDDTPPLTRSRRINQALSLGDLETLLKDEKEAVEEVKRKRTTALFQRHGVGIDPNSNPDDTVVGFRKRKRSVAVIESVKDPVEKTVSTESEGLRIRTVEEILSERIENDFARERTGSVISSSSSEFFVDEEVEDEDEDEEKIDSAKPIRRVAISADPVTVLNEKDRKTNRLTSLVVSHDKPPIDTSKNNTTPKSILKLPPIDNPSHKSNDVMIRPVDVTEKCDDVIVKKPDVMHASREDVQSELAEDSERLSLDDTNDQTGDGSDGEGLRQTPGDSDVFISNTPVEAPPERRPTIRTRFPELSDDPYQQAKQAARINNMNVKTELIHDPGEFKSLERQVNFLTAETNRLQKNGAALNVQNTKLKNQLLAITKQRYQGDLEKLQSKQIKFEREYWTMPVTDKDRDFLKNCLAQNERAGPDFMRDRENLVRTLSENEEKVEKGILKRTELPGDGQNRDNLYKLLQPSNITPRLGKSIPTAELRKDLGILNEFKMSPNNRLPTLPRWEDMHTNIGVRQQQQNQQTRFTPSRSLNKITTNDQIQVSQIHQRSVPGHIRLPHLETKNSVAFATSDSEEDDKPPPVPQEEWDKLRYQASVVLEENQVLNDQKQVFKKTIADLSQEFNSSAASHDAEIAQLTQERDILANELSLLNSTTSTIEEKIGEISEAHEQLKEKCERIKTEMEGKVSMAEHKQELEKLVKTKTKEIKIVINENVALKSQCRKLCAEKDGIAIRIPTIAAEKTRLNKKIKSLEKEIKNTMPQLKKYLRRVEEASQHESAYKKTLEECIKVAEKTAFDRNILAEIVRRGMMSTGTRIPERNDPRDTWKYQFDNVKIDSLRPAPRRVFDNNTTTNSCLSIEYGNSTASSDSFDLNVQFGDLWKSESVGQESNGSNNYGNTRRKKTAPHHDLDKFLEEQEKELDHMKEMIRLKQTYIERLQGQGASNV